MFAEADLVPIYSKLLTVSNGWTSRWKTSSDHHRALCLLAWPPGSSCFLAPTLQTKPQLEFWPLFRSRQQTAGSHHSRPASGYTSSGSPSPGPPPSRWPLTNPTIALQSWRQTPWITWWGSSVLRADLVSSGSASQVRAPGGPVPPILSPSPWGTILLSSLKVMFPGILCLGCEWWLPLPCFSGAVGCQDTASSKLSFIPSMISGIHW